jgi:hypothetical protein
MVRQHQTTALTGQQHQHHIPAKSQEGMQAASSMKQSSSM